MSCQVTSIPTPPTTLPSCVVPIGGSNTTILDTCCNGHINSMATYSAPGSSSNAKSDNGCFQFCTTDDPENVSDCLLNTLGEFSKGAPIFECFNVRSVKKGSGAEGSGYSSSGVRLGVRELGWKTGAVLGLGLVGAAVGAA